MIKNFSAECTYNKLIVVQSLPDGELKTGLRLAYDELDPLCNQYQLGLDYVQVANEKQFIRFMWETKNECNDIKKPIFPIIHFDIHGLENKSGLVFSSGDELSWDKFIKYCREVNRACKNNLVIVLSVCYGFHSILKVDIKDVTPFYMLIGPDDIVKVDFIQKNIPNFYRTLIEKMNINLALEHLSPIYKEYLCERLFVKSFYHYIRQHCKGKGKQDRIENLITQFRNHKGGVIDNIKVVRDQFKELVKPNEQTFYKYKDRFLLSNYPDNINRFDFDYKDILDLINNVT